MAQAKSSKAVAKGKGSRVAERRRLPSRGPGELLRTPLQRDRILRS